MLIQDYPILQWLPGLCTNWFPTHFPALVPYHCLSVALVPATLASLFYSKTDTLCLGDFAFVGPLPRTLSSVSAQLASLVLKWCPETHHIIREVFPDIPSKIAFSSLNSFIFLLSIDVTPMYCLYLPITYKSVILFVVGFFFFSLLYAST